MIVSQRTLPVWLVVAPEGFGKTERIQSANAHCDRPVLHFYPQSDQTSMFDLLHGFVQSISGVVRGMTSSFAGAVEYARGAPEPQEELALWVIRHLTGVKAMLVVHDLDRVHDERFLDLLRRVVEGAESSLHWTFVARTVPDLPWADWEAYGLAAAPCTTDDLSLSLDEALEMARYAGIDAQTATRLHELTGGWPLGMRLALRSPHDLQSLIALPRSSEEIGALLVKRAINGLDEATRETLIQLSVLAEFDPAFASANGFAERWPRIAVLADESLMLVHLPGGVVKYRDVFRSEFFRRLDARGPDAVANARIDAARAYEESGRLLTALRLYAGWDFSDDVLRLCQAHGFDFLDQGHASALQNALAAVERVRLEQNAVTLAILAMEESRAGRRDIAEAWFVQAMARADTPVTRASVAYRCVLERVRAGRIDGLELLEPLLGDTSLPLDLRASVYSTLATAYVLSEQFANARSAIDDALSVAEQFGDATVLAKILHHAAWVALFTGDVRRAKDLGQRAVSTAAACCLYDWAARACTVLYNIAYDIEDDPAQSAELLDRILDYGTQAGSSPMRLFALLGKFDLATERGDAQSLQKIERALLAHDLHFSNAMTSAALVSGQALFLAGRGRYGEAYDLLLPTVEHQVTKDRRALRFAEMALYAAAADRRAQAIEAAKNAEAMLPELQHDRRMVRAEGTLVLAYRLLGEDERARVLLDDLQAQREALTPRARTFIDSVAAVATRWSGVANRTVLTSRLDGMLSRDLGGYAALLTSLPLHADATSWPAKSIASSIRQSETLADAREEIVALALETCAPRLRQTLLSDLVASATIDRLLIWIKDRNDASVIEWVQSQLQERHNLDPAAHLFGDTIGAAISLLHRRHSLDREAEAAMRQLRQSVDAHVSATQIRVSGDLVDPVDPVDAKIHDLLHRLFLRDEITFEHSRCVGAWCARLAKRMHLTREDAQLVMRSGLVHDVGKVLTPPDILKAPRGLTEGEWVIMRRHTLDGVRLLEPVYELRTLIPAVRWHHERYDGTGYPDRMPLQDIPFAARIVAVADAFNAMIARRPYRDPTSPPEAIERLKAASGTQFDPAVVSHMIDVVLRPDR